MKQEEYKVYMQDNNICLESSTRQYLFDVDIIEYFSFEHDTGSKMIPIIVNKHIFPYFVTNKSNQNSHIGTLIVGVLNDVIDKSKNGKKYIVRKIKIVRINNVLNIDQICEWLAENEIAKFTSYIYKVHIDFHYEKLTRKKTLRVTGYKEKKSFFSGITVENIEEYYI